MCNRSSEPAPMKNIEDPYKWPFVWGICRWALNFPKMTSNAESWKFNLTKHTLTTATSQFEKNGADEYFAVFCENFQKRQSSEQSGFKNDEKDFARFSRTFYLSMISYNATTREKSYLRPNNGLWKYRNFKNILSVFARTSWSIKSKPFTTYFAKHNP